MVWDTHESFDPAREGEAHISSARAAKVEGGSVATVIVQSQDMSSLQIVPKFRPCLIQSGAKLGTICHKSHSALFSQLHRRLIYYLCNLSPFASRNLSTRSGSSQQSPSTLCS